MPARAPTRLLFGLLRMIACQVALLASSRVFGRRLFVSCCPNAIPLIARICWFVVSRRHGRGEGRFRHGVVPNLESPIRHLPVCDVCNRLLSSTDHKFVMPILFIPFRPHDVHEHQQVRVLPAHDQRQRSVCHPHRCDVSEPSRRRFVTLLVEWPPWLSAAAVACCVVPSLSPPPCFAVALTLVSINLLPWRDCGAVA
jgi:hypothetical protein